MRMLAVRIVQTLQALAGLALLLMIGVILYQVLLRYGFSDGIIWGEEFARIMMIAAALLGAAVAHWHGEHIRFDLLEHALQPGARRVLAIVSELVVCGTATLLAVSGWELAAENELQESLTLGVSMVYVYALIPIGFGWMAVASLRRLLVLALNPADKLAGLGEQQS